MARLLSGCTDAIFTEVSATIASVDEVRSILKGARNNLQLTGRFVSMSRYLYGSYVPSRRTILFLDEIHHFSRSQQVSLAYFSAL